MNVLRNSMALMAVVTALGVSVPAWAASDSEPPDEQLVHDLLDSLMEDDYDRFVTYVTPEFMTIAARDFAYISTHLSPRLEKGYDVEYFGMLQQLGYDISVWKISFSDNFGDMLATMNLQGGKVAGFHLQ